MPRLVLSLSPVLGIPVVFRLRVGPKGWKLKAVIKDPEGKLAIALWKGEQVLIHVLATTERKAQKGEGTCCITVLTV